MLEFFLVFQLYFWIFSTKKIWRKKPILSDVEIHIVNIYRSCNFFWVFSDPNSFCFLCSSYQKKVRAVGSFPPQNQSKLTNQTGRNHCELDGVVQLVTDPPLTNSTSLFSPPSTLHFDNFLPTNKKKKNGLGMLSMRGTQIQFNSKNHFDVTAFQRIWFHFFTKVL